MAGLSQEENPLPRELAPGVFWMGNCGATRNVYKGTVLHSYDSVYLVVGSECSAIVEGGDPKNLPYIEEQLDSLLTSDVPDVRYIFLTHQETPHSSGVGRFLQRFPASVACGNVNDYHLAFPQYADRFREVEIGESVDLGGRAIDVVEAPFRDYIYTRWFFDTKHHALFSGDGFAYSHYHGSGHCGKVAEEAPELALPEMIAVYSEKAFFWTQFVDIEPYISRLEWLLSNLDAQILAPTHGLPVLSIGKTLPELIAGLRLGNDRGKKGILNTGVVGI
jgi:flavorubredoxin